jgi:hypothetical protein
MPREKVCPCCKRPLPPKIIVGGRIRQRVLDYVAKSAGVTTQQIMDHVYADDPNGGPDSVNVITSTVRHINKRIKPYGLRIKGSGGPGSTYSLVRLEPEALAA